MEEFEPQSEEKPSKPRKHFSISRRTKVILGTVGISAFSSIVVVGAAGTVAWHYRKNIFNELYTAAIQSTVATIPILNTTSATTTALVDIPHDLSVTDVVAKANKSVVSIEVYQSVPVYSTDVSGDADANNPFAQIFPGLVIPSQVQTGTQLQKVGGGTGFFVTADGLIVTNRHVVDFTNASFKAVTIDGKKYTATVIAKDPVLDVAVLKVVGSGFTPITLGNSDALQLGQSVVAIGYALGQFNNSISVGVVSGLSRNITAGDESGNSELLDKVIQTDAAINPGNSGGPLLNLRGDVVGIDVATAEGSQSIGFALPINSVKQVINSVEQTGKIVRPYVGIRYVQITDALQKQNNLSVNYGILVKRGDIATDLAVLPGSPADKAGIVENDIILSIDGTKLDSNANFATIIRGKKVGQTITLVVLDKGVQRNVQLTLEQSPS